MEDNTLKLLGELILGAPSLNYKKNLNKLQIETDLSNDEIASEHYALFGLTVFPFSHYYLSESRNFAGDFDGHIISKYQEYEFDFNKISYGMGPTHLGTILLFMDHLNILKKHHELRSFIASEFLSWFKVFANSVHETTGEIFKEVISLIEKEVILMWKKLNGMDHLDEITFYQHDFHLEKFISDEKTSLKDICDFLITPSLCGVFISKPMLANLASSLNIPIGFGDRSLLINDLLREANNYEVMGKLTKVLTSYFELQKSSYTTFEIENVKHYWIQKIEVSQKLVDFLNQNVAIESVSL